MNEPTTGAYRPDIQGLRALAVLVVVVYHAGVGLPGGFIGVDVFFVVSGYVITKMLRREQAESGRIRLGTFYLRRIRRLLPALALLLVAVFVALPLLGPLATQGVSRRTGLAGALFVSNVALARGDRSYFAPDADANPFLHLWSLSVEEQFYLGFPLLMLVSWALVGRRRWAVPGLAAVLGVVALVSFALNLWLLSDASRYNAGYSEQLAFFLSPPRAWELLVGALVALWPVVPARRVAAALSWGGLALVAYAVLAFDALTPFPGSAALLPVAGAALLLAGGRNPDTAPSRLLSTSPAGWIGDRSYAWYLWHWPLIVFARASLPDVTWAVPVAAVVALVPAALSYSLVETPIRHRRSAPSLRTLALGCICIVVPIAAGVGAGLARRALPERVDEFAATFGEHVDKAEGCDRAGGDATPEECTWEVSDPVGRAVLVGDSNAGHLSSGFLAAAEELSLTATIQTRSSCTFVDLGQPTRPGGDDFGCRDHYADTMQWLEETRPDLVVLAGATDNRLRNDDLQLIDPATGERITAATAKADLWEAAMHDTLTALESWGIATVVVHPVPRFPDWPDPDLCSPLSILIDEALCGTERSTSAARADAQVAIDAEAAAAVDVSSVHLLDVWSYLCPTDRCSTYRDGAWWFMDRSHITVFASEQLTGPLSEAMAGSMADWAGGGG